jgi:hypothetical protein
MKKYIPDAEKSALPNDINFIIIGLPEIIFINF